MAAPRSAQDAASGFHLAQDAAEEEAGRGRSNSLPDCQDYDWAQLWAGGVAGEWRTGEPGEPNPAGQGGRQASSAPLIP